MIERHVRASQYSRKDHGTVSSGTEDFSANDSHHTLTTAGSHTWTLSGFSSVLSEMSILLTVSSGTPTITLPGAVTIAADSAQNLSAMASGIYLVSITSSDNGTSYTLLCVQDS